MNTERTEKFVNAIACDLEEGGFRQVSGTMLRRTLATAVSAALPLLQSQTGTPSALPSTPQWRREMTEAKISEAVPALWGVRIGDSDTWGYVEVESDADFIGKKSGLSYEKRPLYLHPQPTARQISEGDRRVLEKLMEALPTIGLNGWAVGVEVLGRVLDDSLDAPQPAERTFDVEAMLAACVPGGSIVDPQVVADNIRVWAAERQPAELPEPSGNSGEMGEMQELVTDIYKVASTPGMTPVDLADWVRDALLKDGHTLAETGKQQVGESCTHEWRTAGGGSQARRPLVCSKCNQHRDHMPQQVGEVQGDALHDARLLLAKHLEKESPGGAQKLRLASAMDLASSPTIMAALTAIAEALAARQPGVVE